MSFGGVVVYKQQSRPGSAAMEIYTKKQRKEK